MPSHSWSLSRFLLSVTSAARRREEEAAAAATAAAVTAAAAAAPGSPGDMAAALPACYHGAITRRECELLLGEKKQDGAYMLRDSETIQGALCLCV